MKNIQEIEDLKKQWEQDSKINREDLTEESLKIPQLHSKYLNFMMDEKISLDALEYSYNVLLKKKTLYYSGEMSKEELDENGWEPFLYNKKTKSGIQILLDGDNDLQIKRAKINLKKTKIYFLEEVIKSISFRSNTIKNAIEWQKFTNGII